MAGSETGYVCVRLMGMGMRMEVQERSRSREDAYVCTHGRGVGGIDGVCATGL